MNHLEVQVVYAAPGLPTKAQIQQWVDACLQDDGKETEIVVRIVDVHESSQLNKQFRHKPGPTNILSFPAEIPEDFGLNLLGDLVVCAPVLEREAREQQKLLSYHWAHIIIHGVLHLLGYDHIVDEDAEVMETKEITILQGLNIPNPYLEAIQQ